MRLTRNTTPDGKCKYALVRLDKLRKMPEHLLVVKSAIKALDELAALGFLEYGQPGTDEEFFAIKLKDISAPSALFSYAEFAELSDPELAKDVRELAARSQKRQGKRKPD